MVVDAAAVITPVRTVKYEPGSYSIGNGSPGPVTPTTAAAAERDSPRRGRGSARLDDHTAPTSQALVIRSGRWPAE